MTYLMRKITPLRWTQEQHDIHSNEDINAESLSDLCADENAISTWYVGEKTEENIIKAVTALASGFRSLDELSIVLIDDDMIKKAGLPSSCMPIRKQNYVYLWAVSGFALPANW